MNLLKNYKDALQAIYDHVGNKDGFAEYALDDKTNMYWTRDGESVCYGPSEDEIECYQEDIIRKRVWIGKDYTMMLVDGSCGIFYNAVFDNTKKRNAALEAFFKLRGYKYKAETPLVTKVVRAVFGGIDRRRTSTYSLVLRQAIKEKISPLSLAKWIEDKGGIQEIKCLAQ